MFETIAVMKGQGNSDSVRNYTYLDKEFSNSMAFYRLKQVDYNGRASYSDIILVSCPESGITVYPNPASEELRISYDEMKTGPVEVVAYDLNGRKMGSWNAPNFNKKLFILNISHLRPGMYNFMIRIDHKIWNKGIVISRYFLKRIERSELIIRSGEVHPEISSS